VSLLGRLQALDSWAGVPRPGVPPPPWSPELGPLYPVRPTLRALQLAVLAGAALEGLVFAAFGRPAALVGPAAGLLGFLIGRYVESRRWTWGCAGVTLVEVPPTAPLTASSTLLLGSGAVAGVLVEGLAVATRIFVGAELLAYFTSFLGLYSASLASVERARGGVIVSLVQSQIPAARGTSRLYLLPCR